MTVRGDVVAAAVAAWAALDGVAEVELMPSGDPAAFPALQIFDLGHRIEDGEAGSTRYALTLGIDGYIEASEGPDALAELNDLYAATVKAVMGEPPLGGLVESVDEGDLRISVAPLADTRRLAFSLDMTFRFSARRDDPAEPA